MVKDLYNYTKIVLPKSPEIISLKQRIVYPINF